MKISTCSKLDVEILDDKVVITLFEADEDFWRTGMVGSLALDNKTAKSLTNLLWHHFKMLSEGDILKDKLISYITRFMEEPDNEELKQKINWFLKVFCKHK